jgi:pilus assembly protein CpaC
MIRHSLRGTWVPTLIVSALVGIVCGTARAQQQELQPASIVCEIRAASERQEMTVNTSRILTLAKSLTEANRIRRAQVNNPDVLDVTPLSADQVQIAAKKAGVTQVNLWDENGGIYTIDVIVYGDAQELSMILESEFPNASLSVKPISNGVLISGYVDQPEDIRNIVQIAEEYYPKVVNLIRVGGVHQVLLHVKAMEVSRTKLRNLGFDWEVLAGTGLFVTGTSGLINTATLAKNPAANLRFDILGDTDFFGVLEAMRQDNLAKLLAEPTLVTSSGRPAYFTVGGEVPYLVPQGLGATSIDYKEYGTRIDFVPIVLGNARIRLEVRPHVSDIDNGRSIMDNGQTIYAFKKQEVDTGVTLQAGQTLAIAGLVQNRVESTRRGVPWASDLPYLGVLFRRVEEETNEIETLIFVTPELVDAMYTEEVPPCGPGLRTGSPTDFELGVRGYIEVPKCCPPGEAGTMPGMIPGQPGQVLPSEPTMLPEPILPPQPFEPSARGPRATRSSSVSGKPASRRLRPAPLPTKSMAARSGAPLELPGFLGPIGYERD